MRKAESDMEETSRGECKKLGWRWRMLQIGQDGEK